MDFTYGSDNVKIKEADFYYWDPTESTWFFLATQSSNDSNQVLTPSAETGTAPLVAE